MVANCLSPAVTEADAQNDQPSSSNPKEEKGNPISHRDISLTTNKGESREEPEILHHASSRLQYLSHYQFLIYYLLVCYFVHNNFCRYSTLEGGFMNWRKLGDGFEYASPIRYNQEYREVEMEKEVADNDTDNESSPQWEEDSEEEGTAFNCIFCNICNQLNIFSFNNL